MVDASIPIHWRRFDERYRLTGNKCTNCGSIYFPARPVCVKCRSKGKLVKEQMPFTGKIYSHTKVLVGPIGFEFETPYFIGIIELDNGVKILAQIVDSEESKVKIGAKVSKLFRKISDRNEEGVIAYGYKFKVV
ncbi:MAG TPA: Zn-ribbon domain-containing OB-fold protein [archaeon]|nr:Zn-ribbon domain-containing OB-fold protein [archaeon]